VLVRNHAIPEPTFLWWDARLQPAFGTLEVRIMDAQTRVGDTAAIAALVQCLVRLEGGRDVEEPPEVLSENRFVAARDGMQAQLMTAPDWRRQPIREILSEVLEACEPVAAELECSAELARVAALAASPGAERQRELAAQAGSLEGLVEALSDDFAREAAESSLAA
jgi:carboxylate-amine ligase